MKAYIATSGIIFALIVAVHLARLVAEGPHLLQEPVFLGSSLLTFALSLWAGLLYRRLSRLS